MNDFQNEFRSAALNFLSRLDAALSSRGVELPRHWDVDHLCYRVATLDRYENLKVEIARTGKLLVESIVNGRPITTFKLDEPIPYREAWIDVLELPAPKLGKRTQEGFEHIEVVCDEPFSALRDRFKELELDEAGVSKKFNAELELALGKENIKFHHLSLESVVRVESNERIFRAIEESRILETLAPFDPIMVGTIPLGIDTDSSDIDIVTSWSGKTPDALLKALSGYETRRLEINGRDTILARFSVNGVPFEIFAQEIPSSQQEAHLHFLVEERLLKFGGESLRSEIRSLRQSGLKTEPAFATALGLSGDPYRALLDLQMASPVTLTKILLDRIPSNSA